MKCGLNKSPSFFSFQNLKENYFIIYLFIPTLLFSISYLKLLKVRIKIMKAIFYPDYFAGYNKSCLFIIGVFLVYPQNNSHQSGDI